MISNYIKSDRNASSQKKPEAFKRGPTGPRLLAIN